MLLRVVVLESQTLEALILQGWDLLRIILQVVGVGLELDIGTV